MSAVPPRKPLATEAAQSGGHPVLRALGLEDLDQMEAIEQSSYDFPWTRDIFRDCMKVGYGCFGLQVDDRLVAYAIHNWAADESHLLNLCVDTRWRRRGFGGILLDHVIEHARCAGCRVLLLEVRPSNPVAKGIYRERGFRRIGRRPDYYRSHMGREDAIVMRLDL